MSDAERQALLVEQAPAMLDGYEGLVRNGKVDDEERDEIERELAKIDDAVAASLNGHVDEARTELEARIRDLRAALAGGVEIVALIQKPREDLSEDGNALRFVADHADVARYVPGVGWHVWDGRRWRRDDDGGAERLAKETARSIAREAELITKDEEAKKVFSHHRASRRANSIAATLKLARTEKPLIARAEDLDADVFTFNVANGTLDLRSGELRAHRPDDQLTKLAPVDWDPDATAPRWLRALDQIFLGDAELIAFVQRAFGYSLTGVTDEQCLFFCFGEGGNGKTTVREIQRALVGEYGELAASGSLMAKRAESIPNDLAGFRGARVLQCAETREGAKLDEVLVKEATGGDEVKARFLYGEWFAYRPQFKIWMTGNHRPEVRGEDDAIWDRIRPIPFGARLRGSDEEEKGLADKLLAELPGILSWAVEGCLAWQSDGLGEPPAVRDAAAEYRAEQDSIAAFIAERCVFGDGRDVTKANLYAAYKDHCRETGSPARSDKALGKRVRAIESVSEGSNGVSRFWTGIGVTTDDG